MTNPYWYKLIKLLKRKGKITTGLTIPYLFGAYKLLDVPFSNLSTLISEVHNSVIDKYPIIQKCHEINQHVIMVEKKEICHKYYGKEVKLINKNENNFLFISSNTNLGKTLDKVSFNLNRLYLKPIKEDKFSWNNSSKSWIKFSDEEKELIMSIK